MNLSPPDENTGGLSYSGVIAYVFQYCLYFCRALFAFEILGFDAAEEFEAKDYFSGGKQLWYPILVSNLGSSCLCSFSTCLKERDVVASGYITLARYIVLYASQISCAFTGHATTLLVNFTVFSRR